MDLNLRYLDDKHSLTSWQNHNTDAHMRTHTHAHTCTHTHAHAYDTDAHMRTHAHTRTCMHTHMHTHDTDEHMRTHAHICTHTRTHTHRDTQFQIPGSTEEQSPAFANHTCFFVVFKENPLIYMQPLCLFTEGGSRKPPNQ